MDNEKLSEELMLQVERLRERAMISTDPNVVAQAIAVSDPEVRSLLLKKLAEGCEIAGVRTLNDLDLNSKRVYFKIRPEGARVNLSSSGFLAVVDMTTASVSTITDPYDSQDAEAASRLPFVLEAPSWISTPDDLTVSEARQEEETRFLDKLGITPKVMMNRPPEKLPGPSHGGGAGTTTYLSTIIPSATFSFNPRHAQDDTQGDRFPEAADSGYA